MTFSRLRAPLLFPWTTLAIGLILSVATYATYKELFSYGAAQLEEYQTLVTIADPSKDEETTPYTATQQHRQAHKDIWFSERGQRLHLTLRSADAELVFDRKEDRTEMVERMRDVVCLMQEELYYLLPDGREALFNPEGQLVARHNGVAPHTLIAADTPGLKPMQTIRYIEAEYATYHYQTDRLYAKDVKVSRYQLPGHTLVNTVRGLRPLMTGTAGAVEFLLTNHGVKFKAHRFKASLPVKTRGKR